MASIRALKNFSKASVRGFRNPSRAGVRVAYGTVGATAAPAITSLNYDLGDTLGGGQSIVITGTDFTSGVPYVDGVAIGGGLYSVDSPTQITFTLPAHASGVVDVTVVGPGGTSNTSSFEYWNPTQITSVDIVLDSDVGVTPTGVGNEVDSWADRVASVLFEEFGAPPDEIAGVFGTLPAVRFTPNDFLTTAAIRYLPTGCSMFFVGSWASADTASSISNHNAPLSVIGETGGGSWGTFGASGDALHAQWYDSGGGASYGTTRGSGLNDGTVRLLGFTFDEVSGDRKLYVGETQEGATDTPGTYDTTYMSYDTIGAGYSAVDGFDGDLGAVIVVGDVISAGDLTKLNKWSKQRFGTP